MQTEPVPRVEFSANISVNTLQGQEVPPDGLLGIQSEYILLAPQRVPRLGYFAYGETISGPSAPSYSTTVCGLPFSVKLTSVPLLIEVAGWNLQQTDMGFSASGKSASVQTTASGCVPSSNTTAGMCAINVAPDFSQNVYTKMMSVGTTTPWEKKQWSAGGLYELLQIEDAKYDTHPIRISPSSWANTPFHELNVYVIFRSEMANGFSFTVPAGRTYVPLVLPTNTTTVPAYSRVWVDPGDPAMSVFHIHMTLTSNALGFVTMANHVFDGVPASLEYLGDPSTWLCSVVFTRPGAVPLGISTWKPELRSTAASAPPRVAAYTGLKAGGNLITAAASMEAEMPLATMNQIYPACAYGMMPNPRTFAEFVASFHTEKNPRTRDLPIGWTTGQRGNPWKTWVSGPMPETVRRWQNERGDGPATMEELRQQANDPTTSFPNEGAPKPSIRKRMR